MEHASRIPVSKHQYYVCGRKGASAIEPGRLNDDLRQAFTRWHDMSFADVKTRLNSKQAIICCTSQLLVYNTSLFWFLNMLGITLALFSAAATATGISGRAVSEPSIPESPQIIENGNFTNGTTGWVSNPIGEIKDG